MNARRRWQRIRELLGDRDLIYVGPRGEDALPLLPLGSQEYVFSLIAPAESGAPETCLEMATGVRVDLNDYSLDDDWSPPASQFRAALLARFSESCAVIPYSPSRTISRGWLTARDTVLPLGLFYEHQACFDYKPWVESELGNWGVATIPWTYVHSLSSSRVTELLGGDSPVVVRWPRSRGGAGIWLIRDREELAGVAEQSPGEGLFCVTPYFASAISVNVNACVFPGGSVSIHGSSVQLVGIEICTPRPLGYAGNDFATIAELPPKALCSLDMLTRTVGAWLSRHGYLGAFGVDALVIEDRVLFVELNPRFQASSAVASRLDDARDRPDQYSDHIAAFLGLGASDQLTLTELVKEQEAVSQVMLYNSGEEPVNLQQRPELAGGEARLLPASGVFVEPRGLLAAILWKGRVTETGGELREEVGAAVGNLRESFSRAER